jgi:hypothetical protein
MALSAADREKPDRDVQSTNPSSPGRASSAYTLGKRINELRWLLEQSLLLSRDFGTEIDDNFKRLIPCARALVSDPAVVQVERAIDDQLKWFTYIKSSENAADESGETFQQCKDLFLGEETAPEDERADVTRLARFAIREIEEAVAKALGDRQDLLAAVELGELVDQGVRPQDSKQFIFQVEPNPEWWVRRRSPAYRHDMRKYRVATAVQRQYEAEHTQKCDSYEEDEEENSPTPAQKPLSLPPRSPQSRRPKLPEKERIVVRFLPGVHRLDEWSWARHVREHWFRMELPTALPRVLLAVYKRPGNWCRNVSVR